MIDSHVESYLLYFLLLTSYYEYFKILLLEYHKFNHSDFNVIQNHMSNKYIFQYTRYKVELTIYSILKYKNLEIS